MTDVSFSELSLIPPLLRALDAKGYETPTPIQAQAIPPLLEGVDLLGVAQTGTGKTAAFSLPLLQHLAERPAPRGRPIRALVLTPTRELAAQIGDNLAAYGKRLGQKHIVIFGGVGQRPQVDALKRGVPIVVATPGRLLDLMGQGYVDLSRVEYFVLDEADRMLDMGFIHDVRKVIDALPDRRQSALFSATMPNDIVKLAERLLNKPRRVEVTPPATTVERIEQGVLFVEKEDKRALLAEILANPELRRTLVFTRTKHGANRAAKHLQKNDVPADAIHGNKSQSARERALEKFRKGEIRVLVATDIAARGIDVAGITHVINFDLPNIPESYVHRIGRTARAGSEGVALSFCDVDERAYLKDIEKTIRQRVRVIENHPYRSNVPMNVQPPPAAKSSGRRRRRRR
ncbi:MAG: DEAD/DEAH box helicase [Deltaproteobacteria bacterium]